MVASTLAPISVQGSSYTHEERLQAATAFVLTGSMAVVCRQTGIAESTLSGWRRTDWFLEMCEELRREKNIEIDFALARIITKAMAGMEERIDHGDTVLSEGQLVRVPVKAKDLAVITGVFIDKRQALREQIRTDTALIDQNVNHLEKLRDRLRALNANVVAAHDKDV